MKFDFVKMKAIWFILFALLTLSVTAQKKVITGKVTDSSGLPIPGATIVVKAAGAVTGSVTNMDGKYSVEVPAGINTLNFAFVGMKSVTETINNRSVIDVVLEEDVVAVSDVIVIGYGTVKKSDATGSVSSVSAKDFNKGGVTSPQELIIGKSAGVVITTGGGAPGSGSTIRIRGGSSLNASNDPLIIIDGVPIANSNISGSANFLSFVNPNDIETFTILKDASSTAIYGSGASNGVILITTKKGTIGSPVKITFNGNTSISNAIKYLDVYSGDEVRQIAFDHKELYGADTYTKLGSYNTRWQQELFRTAVSQDHNLSISGAYKALPYRISAGYTNQQGIMKNTDMQRYTGSLNLSPVLLKGNLKLNINAKGMATDNNFGDSGALGSAVNMDPTQFMMVTPNLPIFSNGIITVPVLGPLIRLSNF
jgi:TonB-linked SusC/RagA family outer membrane protein